MTETPQQSTEQPDTSSGEQSGVHRDHLRNYEQLRRSVSDRRVAGVAGGLGRHLNVDPTVLRVLFVVLCFFGGAGFVLYGAAWLLVPEEGRADGAKINLDDRTRNTVLIVIGVVAALLLIGDSWGGVGPWPLIPLGVAAVLYLIFRERRHDRAEHQPVSSPYGPPTAPAPGATGTGGSNPGWVGGSNPGWVGGSNPGWVGGSNPGRVGGSNPGWVGASDTGWVGDGGAPPSPPWLPATQHEPPTPPPTRKRGPKLFGPTLLLLMVALGSLGLIDTLGTPVPDAAYAALALAVIGLMLLVGAFVGRPGGLILLGVISSVVLAGTSANDLGWQDGEHLRAHPTSAAGVHDRYHVDSGNLRLDLSDVTDPDRLDGRTIRVDAGAGDLLVVLPDGVSTEVHARIGGPGQIELPDRSSGGFSSDLDGSYGSGDATVTIDADLSVGHIEVRNP